MRQDLARLRNSGGAKRAAIFSALDQAVSSATNFGSTIAAAVLLSATSFGQFSIAYIVYVIVVGAFQAYIGQELVLRSGDPKSLREASGVAIRFSLAISVPVAVGVTLLVAIFLPESLVALLPFVLALPFLVGQEIMRFACAVQGRMRVALALDSIWLACAVVLLLTVAFVVPRDSIQAWLIAAAWSLAGVISFAVGSFILPWTKQSANAHTKYLTRNYIGRRFLVEFLAMRGTSQSLGLALGGLSGVASAGAYRGASTLSGPLAVLLGTVASFGAPMLRDVESSKRTFWLARLALLLAGLAGGWTLVLALIPESIGRLVLGETWFGARSLLIPLALQTVALGISIPFFMGLRVHWPRVTLWVQLTGSVLTVVLFFFGLATWGVVGAAWGQFAAAGLQAIVVCGTYLRFSRRGLA